MGSPSSRLKTQERFRPWVDAGLEYVFAPGQAKAGVLSQSVGQTQDVPQRSVAKPTQQPTKQAPQSSQQTPQRAAPQPAQSNSYSQARNRQWMQEPATPRSKQNFQAAPVSTPQGQGTAFPQPWAGFLSKVKAKAPKVVCTYMELGLDLGGQPDRRRADVLRNTLTHHLKWPPGTAAFWPVAALENGTLQPNPAMFWEGWKLWRSPYILCFGDEALRVIQPDSERGATVCLLEHVAIHVVPPLAKLVDLLPHEQQMAMEQLSTIRL